MHPSSNICYKTSIVWKTIFLLQLFTAPIVRCVVIRRRCPRQYLESIKYDCNLKINIANRIITCRDYSTLEKLDEGEFHIFQAIFRTNGSVIAMNEHFIESLKTMINETDYEEEISNFYTCERHLQSFPTEYILKTQDCYFSLDCLTMFSKILKNDFITSIEIRDQDIIQFGNLAFMANLDKMLITMNNELVFEEHAFNATSSIKYLFLVENNLNTIPLHLLESDAGLENLDLLNNRTSSTDVNKFKDLRRLNCLDLSNNYIEVLRNDAFVNLKNLKELNLSSNHLKSIASDVFRSNSLLVEIDLSKNDILFFPEELIWDLKNLTFLKLSNCKLENITENFFQDSINMQHLDLSHNEIKKLPGKIFSRMQNLLYLDLSHNNLLWFPENVFSNSIKLKTLYLSNNEIKWLPENLFFKIRCLQALDISKNKLKFLTDADVKDFEKLKILNLSKNEIEYIELGLYEKVKVQHFNFSMNNVVRFRVQWNNLVDLESMDFSFNKITELLLPPCIENNKRLIKFWFQNNNISNVYVRPESKINAWDSVKITNCFLNDGPKNNVYMSNNPYNCDCRFREFQIYLLKNSSKYEKSIYFPDKDNLKCAYPTDLSGKEVSKLNDDVFVCPIEAGCPKPCSCSKRGKDNRILLNCSFINLNVINSSYSAETSVLYFQNNNLKSLRDIRVPYWNETLELWVDNNLLESIEFEDLPKSLEVLSVTGNRLKTISEALQNFMTSKKAFTLFARNNTWDCNCESRNFRGWLKRYSNITRDSENITCRIQTTGGNAVLLPLTEINDIDLCSLEMSQKIKGYTIILSITVGFFVVCILIVALLYCKNQNTIHAYIYIHCGNLFRCFFVNQELDENEEFDAFVAYGRNDRELVMKIIEELEHKAPFFKLCIPDRNSIPGNCISEIISYAVQNSKRTIIMLSEDFISSIRLFDEVRAALFHILQDRINHLIIVVVGKFPDMDMLDDDFRQMLLKKKYLEWGERWFWEKLRYTMPRHLKSRTEAYHKKRKRETNLVLLVENEITTALTSVRRTRDLNSEAEENL